MGIVKSHFLLLKCLRMKYVGKKMISPINKAIKRNKNNSLTVKDLPKPAARAKNIYVIKKIITNGE